MKRYKGDVPELMIKFRISGVKKAHIKTSGDAWEFFKEVYDLDDIEYRESSMVLYLNRANNTIAWFRLSVGGTAGTIIDPKIIVKTALDCGAHSVIMSHNHPSGNMRPSQPDTEITKKINKALGYFDITLFDHIIIGVDSYFSFADEGLI